MPTSTFTHENAHEYVTLPNPDWTDVVEPYVNTYWNKRTGQILTRRSTGFDFDGNIRCYEYTLTTPEVVTALRQACEDIADGCADASPRDRFANDLLGIIKTNE